VVENQAIQKYSLELSKIPIIRRDTRTIDRSRGAGYDSKEGAGQEPEV